MDIKTLYDKGWERDDIQSLAKHHLLAASLVDSGEVLDLGCSDGLFLEILKKRNINGKGIDISPFIVEKGKSKNLDIVVGDITEPLHFADGSYEYVAALNVIEHLFDPQEFVSEMARVSKAYVIIATPNFVSLPARLQVLLGKVPENNTLRKHHVVWMTWKVLREMLERNNLQICEASNNTFWEERPILGSITKFLVKIWPSLFALSFTIKAEKVEYFKRGLTVEKNEVITYYDKIYDKGGADAIRPLWDYKKKLSYLGRLQKGKKILDVGCGTGYTLKLATDVGLIATGVEISPRAANIASKVAPNAEVLLGEGENLPLKDDEYDYVVCLGSLEHFNDIPKALSEMLRVSKRGARFLIMVPNRDYFFWRVTGVFGTKQVKEVLLNLKEWEDLFSTNGFIIESVYQDKWAAESVKIFSVRHPIKILRRVVFKIIWFFMPLKYTYQFAFVLRKNEK